MAARLSHGAATPSSLDLTLIEMSVDRIVPAKDNRTEYGTILRYIIGVKYRTASLTFYIKSATEHDQFWTFYDSVMAANTRATFVADATNFPSDVWSILFTSTPTFDRDRRIGGARIAGELSVDVQDVPSTL